MKLKSVSREFIVTLVVLALVASSLLLAIRDPSIRPAFVDLTKVALVTYMGLHHIPFLGQRR